MTRTGRGTQLRTMTIRTDNETQVTDMRDGERGRTDMTGSATQKVPSCACTT